MNKTFIFIISIAFIASCQNQPGLSSKKIITVSILPQKYFVEAVAGDKFIINVMIPPGGTPESYEPTAHQIQSLSESAIYMKIGHIPFEEVWLKNINKINPSIQVFDLSEGIDLIKGRLNHEGEMLSGIDPHIWISAYNAAIIARNIFQALCIQDSLNKPYYSDRLKKFLALTDSLNRNFKKEFSMMQGSTFLVFHPALAYLARDYGLEQICLEFEGKSPPPGHMKNIIDIAHERKINTIMIQKQFNPDFAITVAKEINGKVIIIDPLDENWDKQIAYIVRNIAGN